MLRDIVSNDFFTVLILACLVLIALAKLLYPPRFKYFTSIITNFRYIRVYSRDQKFLDGFEAILFGNLVIGLAIFSLLFYNYNFEILTNYKLSLLKIGFGTGSFILIKVLIERLISSMLNIETIISNYLFQKMGYKLFLGLLLIPINALLVYSIKPSETILLLFLSILILINCTGLILFYKNNQNIIKKSLFYFILYLCALEIAPYIVLYKIITAT